MAATILQPFQTNSVESAHPSDVIVDIPAESRCRRRRIHRVPPQLRGHQQLYDPAGLSLGPYHNGNPQCWRTEELKDYVVDLFVSDSATRNAAKDKAFFLRQVSKSIHKIRSHYEEVEYDDEALSEIILRDVCFMICYMEMTVEGENICERLGLGMWDDVFIRRDVNLLENQIPLWVIRRLLDLRVGRDDAEKLICEFLGITSVRDKYRLTKLPWDDEPLHLLEARRRISFILPWPFSNGPTDRTTNPNFLTRPVLLRWTRKWSTTTSNGKNASDADAWYKRKSLPFRSVTQLKARGICFEPNYDCLKNVRFTSYSFYGTLHLPIWCLLNSTKVYFSNTVALEMSLGNAEDLVATSYINLMKSLIQKAEDVKELRERGILFVNLANDDQVVKVFNDINTYGLDNYGIFADVKRQIDEHCNSKAKTWVAEFVHSYFRSPWTAIALFTAILLLCFAFLQSLYTIRPPIKK